MKKLSLFIIIAGLWSCSAVKTSYDYDKNTTFSNYKTYAYTDDALNLPVQELNRERMLAAIDQQLASKGFTKSDNPDVLIDLRVKAVQKRDATATTTGNYGMGWRYGYGVGFTTTQVNVNEYVEGTLFVNMVDKASDKLVWQGRGTRVLDEDASPEKREANISNGVAAIFAHYPPKAK